MARCSRLRMLARRNKGERGTREKSAISLRNFLSGLERHVARCAVPPRYSRSSGKGSETQGLREETQGEVRAEKEREESFTTTGATTVLLRLLLLLFF